MCVFVNVCDCVCARVFVNVCDCVCVNVCECGSEIPSAERAELQEPMRDNYMLLNAVCVCVSSQPLR